MQPMFSIIVVSLNPGDKLLETIASIKMQTYQNYEVIVKDGGSKDGSLIELKKQLANESIDFVEKIHIFEEADKSIYEGMNQATQKAKGQFLHFLNCGDLFYDEKVLENITKEMEKEAESKLYYGDIFNSLQNTKISSNPNINGFACYRNVPCHQACIYSAQLFEARGYEPRYKVRADYEHFLWSYYTQEAKPKYIPVIIAKYEGGGYSETKENRKRSAIEHKEITTMYMGRIDRFRYKAVLLLTLAPLRTKMAESPSMSKIYNGLKRALYRK